MSMTDTARALARFLSERNAALASLDMEWARKMMPQATNDFVRLLAMHTARVECTALSDELRWDSVQWLRERGSKRLNGLDLPEKELPK